MIELVLVGAFDARAQESDDDEPWSPDLEILVVDEGTPQVAGSAHAVSQAQLEQFEHDDIHAVLGHVPGVYVRDEDGFGLRPNIGIRGGNANRSAKITLLEDGIPFAPAPYSAPAAYFFPNVTRMVGVEVVKGSASIQHGPHTVGGAINLRTRAIPEDFAASVDLAGGMYRTGKVHGWVGGGGPRWGVLVEGVGLGSGGFQQLDDGGPSGFGRGEVMLKARATNAPGAPVHTGVELKASYARETSNATYLGLAAEDFAEDPYRRYAATQLARMRWDRVGVEAAWPIAVGKVQIRTVGYVSTLDRVWRRFRRFADGPDLHDLLQNPSDEASKAFLDVLRGDADSTTPGETVQVVTNDRRYRVLGVQSRVRWVAGGPKLRSELEGGVRLHHDQVDRLHTDDAYLMRSGSLERVDDPPVTLVDSRAQTLALAAHLRDTLVFDGRWQVIPGLRVESLRGSFSDDLAADSPAPLAPLRTTRVLPGLGLIGEFSRSLSLFLGGHRGFSPVPPSDDALRAQTAPEMSWNLEAGARLGRGPRRAEVVGFFTDYDDLTSQCTFSEGCDDTQVGEQFNAGRAWIYGVEVLVAHEWRLRGGWSLPLELTYTRTQAEFRTEFSADFSQWGDVRVGFGLPYVPRDQGSLQLGVANPRFRLTAMVRHRGAMLDTARRWPGDDTRDVPPLTTLDLAVNAPLSQALTVYAVGTNLTQAAPVVSWRPVGARPPAPVKVMGGIKIATP